MRFGVMSDTHGNHNFANRAAEAMIEAGAAHIYHLGDDYDDAEMLRYAGLDVRAVPGLWCAEYRRGTAPKIITDEIEGVRLACAHTIDDLRKEKTQADLYFFGHTHHPVAERQDGAILVNPGHLKRNVDRDQRASYALVDIEAGKVVVSIVDFDGHQLLHREFNTGHVEC